MVQSANTGSGSPEPVGSGEHVVQNGECAISLADAAGLFWETLWNDPANAEVKRARGSPHVLMAGDRVHIPEKRPKDEPCATEAKHRFKRKGIPINFEMLIEENGEPLKGKRYVLEIEGRLTDGTIPSNGVVKAKMMPQDSTGELRVHIGDQVRVYPLSFGHLDPPHARSGAEGRLRNLGYLGSAGHDEAFEAALKRFQNDQGIQPTGQLDNATISKLADAHGS